MTRKKIKKHPLDIDHYIGNDFIFLYLQLIGYPDPAPGDIFVHDLKNYRFERLDDVNLSKMLILLEEDEALEILNNSSIIRITEKTISFIQDALNIYIERFIKGELVSMRDAPYKFKKQRAFFMEKIEGEIEDSQAILNFSDADFDNKFNFFECVLALERQGAIKVKNIYNEKRLDEKAFYRVAFEVKNRSLKELGAQKEKRNLKLKCFTRGVFGYFQIKKDSTPKEVGYKNSREYLLLKYLVHKGVGEKVSFNKAYDVIKDGKHYDASEYGDEKERALENAKKKLQKRNRHEIYKIRPYKIVMDKNEQKIWIE